MALPLCVATGTLSNAVALYRTNGRGSTNDVCNKWCSNYKGLPQLSCSRLRAELLLVYYFLKVYAAVANR